MDSVFKKSRLSLSKLPGRYLRSPSQFAGSDCRPGSTVAGQIRPPKENERYFALLRVEAINRRDPMNRQGRVPFDSLTPLHPDQRIVMEHSPTELSTRVVDLMAPIGFGQRGIDRQPSARREDGVDAEDGTGRV